MTTLSAHSASDDACDLPIYKPYFPAGTLKCVGRPLFRSRAGRDYACLLDLEPDVVSWRCVLEPILENDTPHARHHHVDFEVSLGTSSVLIDISAEPATPVWIEDATRRLGCRYQFVAISEFASAPRLQNARDLLRYAGWEAALGDRIRIQMALEEFGSLTLAECLLAIRDGKPMQSIAAMILGGIVKVDLDDAPLGPDTIVRRASV
ncbi:hypothetical protein [Rhizobium sp. SG741]|uniref:hypothetical protein n=1 Tax=Rhizobium sp. SG741 TaxID=2587114 RepID=UPI001043CB11|nr:hypothetical protein [Rhizobium sp. SG741]